MPMGQHARRGVLQGSAGHHPALVLLVKSSWLCAPVLVPLPRGRGRAAVAQHVRQKIIIFLPAASLGPRCHRHSEERFALPGLSSSHPPLCQVYTESSRRAESRAVPRWRILLMDERGQAGPSGCRSPLHRKTRGTTALARTAKVGCLMIRRKHFLFTTWLFLVFCIC